jgi:hypothetical protein
MTDSSETHAAMAIAAVDRLCGYSRGGEQRCVSFPLRKGSVGVLVPHEGAHYYVALRKQEAALVAERPARFQEASWLTSDWLRSLELWADGGVTHAVNLDHASDYAVASINSWLEKHGCLKTAELEAGDDELN